jgi:hypothetical protein
MELRRALLLFAIVLGVAAIVTSVSSPPERDDGDAARRPAERAPAAPTPSSRPEDDDVVNVRFDSSRELRTALVGTGRRAVVTVEVGAPGEVRLDGLGLSSPAEPLTPARFDLLPSSAGRHPVRFTPAGSREERTIGVLQIQPAG